ncbi:hypothetical protein HanXRQr2_Chr17g0824701 [Helianthus annuus]|uniref:Uncharacterized protein n=1 Tax=Helianthus annuus TaxID=4232 RepID=A0A9K3DL41_HELAN|nr:hypothetical protein HanXRQr2_Chr17g0824701 [Helianthus annuus]
MLLSVNHFSSKKNPNHDLVIQGVGVGGQLGYPSYNANSDVNIFKCLTHFQFSQTVLFYPFDLLGC